MIAESADEEGILTAQFDFGIIEKQWQTWPFFRYTRMDEYKNLLKRFE